MLHLAALRARKGQSMVNSLDKLLLDYLEDDSERDDATIYVAAVSKLTKAQIIDFTTPLGAQQVWRLRMDRQAAADGATDEETSEETTTETKKTTTKKKKTTKKAKTPGEVYIDLSDDVLNEPFVLRGDIIRLRHMVLADMQEARKGLTLRKRDIERQGRLLAGAIQTLKSNPGAKTLDDVLAERAAA